MFDLKELERKLDKALDKETKESLMVFLKEHNKLRYIIEEKIKCNNCNKKVEMVDMGKMCPRCYEEQ